MVDIFVGADASPSFDISAWGWFYTPTLTSTPPTTRPTKLEGPHFAPSFVPSRTDPADLTRLEFNVIFDNHPVLGINHAIAPGELLDTLISPEGEFQFAAYGITSDLKLLWTSYPVSYPNGTFSNSGVVSLGNLTLTVASLTFNSSSLGQSRVDPSGVNYGGITYWITGGSGLWKNAKGAMIDMFVAPQNADSYPILAWAIFWI
jgi:hypothetical protein